jgi:hypothetical protein
MLYSLNASSQGFRGVPPPGDSAVNDVQIVLSHFPLLDTSTRLQEAGLKHAGNLANRAELEDAVHASQIPTLVVSGHLHVRDTVTSGGMLQLSFASLIEPPHEVAVIEIEADEGRVTVHRQAIPVRTANVNSEPVLSPATESCSLDDDQWLSTHPSARW